MIGRVLFWPPYVAARSYSLLLLVVPAESLARHVFEHIAACREAGIPMTSAEVGQEVEQVLGTMRCIERKDATDIIKLLTANVDVEYRHALVKKVNKLIGATGKGFAVHGCGALQPPAACPVKFRKPPQQHCYDFAWYLTETEWRVLMSPQIDWNEARLALLQRAAAIGLVNSDENTEVAIWCMVLLCRAPAGRRWCSPKFE